MYPTTHTCGPNQTQHYRIILTADGELPSGFHDLDPAPIHEFAKVMFFTCL